MDGLVPSSHYILSVILCLWDAGFFMTVAVLTKQVSRENRCGMGAEGPAASGFQG